MEFWALRRLLLQPLLLLQRVLLLQSLLLLLLSPHGCIEQQPFQHVSLLLVPSIAAAAASASPPPPAAAAAATETAANGSDIPRGPVPKTMERIDKALPLLQQQTLFIVDNEPVLESHIASNLIHQLLYTLSIPQRNLRLRDEALLLWGGSKRRAAVSLGRWLAEEAESLPEEIQFVFICSAYTRIDPKTFEALLQELKIQLGDVSDKPFVLGWGLTDENPTIIHHFAPAASQVYPHLDAGTLWSRAAFLSLKKAIKETPPPQAIERDFVYELAVHLKNTQQLLLLHSPLFCSTPPLVENYERSQSTYPPLHIRPKQLPGSGAAASVAAAATAAAAARKQPLTAAETQAAAAAEKVAAIHKGCVSFNSGTRHAPVLSHQIFDALIDFDEDLMVQRELVSERFSADEKMEEEYKKAMDELERSRPAFIVEPQDVMVVVKTHSANHAARLPLLRSLWASREVLQQQAQQHMYGGYSIEGSSEQEQQHIKETYKHLSIRFLSDVADPKQGIEALSPTATTADAADAGAAAAGVPAGKEGLCARLQLVLKDFLLEQHSSRRFLIIVDDDTLINFRHLLDLLSLTLQPPVPARGFTASLLGDAHGYRAHWPGYRQLAKDIRVYLSEVAAAEGPAAAAAAAAAGRSAATPLKDSKYTSAQLTAVSQLYGHGGPRPLEAVSPLYLGERYGYSLTGGDSKSSSGNEYATMGGGVVLDRAAVKLLVECIDSGRCRCTADGSADDMILGLWAQQLQLPLLHARGLHQERPADYHHLLVHAITPVSFHRMERTVKGTKKIFNEYVNVSDQPSSSSSSNSSSSSSSISADDLMEIDWIDYDWHHVEDHLWIEREELQELDEGDPTMPRGIGDIFSRHVVRGTRPMTPEELLAHEELEEMSSLHDEL